MIYNPAMRSPGTGTKTARGYWRVVVSVQDEYGRTRPKTFERKSLIDAQHAARMYLAKYGRNLPTPTGTVSDLFAEVSQALWQDLGDKHRKSRELFRRKWESAIGNMKATEIDSPTLTRTIESIGKGKSLSYISKARDTIREAFAYAVSDLGWMERNPADGMRSPKAVRSKKEYPPMTGREYRRVLVLIEDPKTRLAIRLVAECALRPIEACRADPSDLFSVRDRWMLRVPRSKTEAGERSVPVSDDLARLIEQSEPWSVKDPGECIRREWRKHSETRLYDLRGWRIDEWRKAGISAQARSRMAGHVKEGFTQEWYETLSDQELAVAFEGQD